MTSSLAVGKRYPEDGGVSMASSVGYQPRLTTEKDLDEIFGDPHTVRLDAVGFRADDDLPEPTNALLARPPAPIEWLIDDFLIAGDLGFVVGEDGSFKSSIAIHVAAAVAGGYEVFDRFPTCRRSVLLVSAEEQANVLQHRLDAIIAGHHWNRERVLENVSFIADDRVCLSSVRWQTHLLEIASGGEYGLVVMDPLAELLDGDENSNSDLRRVIKFMRSIARRSTTVLIVHHLGKPSDGKRDADRIRGASAIKAASRCTYCLSLVPSGVVIRNLKFSRASKLEPFMVQCRIVAASDNAPMWQSAHFGYVATDVSVNDRGERFVIEQLQRRAGLTTTDLKKLAKGRGVRAVELSNALRVLQQSNLLVAVPGHRGAKHWNLATLPNSAGKVVAPTLPSLPEDAGNVELPHFTPCPPH
jgi:hypothetical protein